MKPFKRWIPIFYLFTSLMSCLSCSTQQNSAEEDISNEAVTSTGIEVPTNPLKNAYFGETHVHTGVSMDAFIGGNRLRPDDAYRFAKGEEMMVNGSLHRLKRPLDFAAISDHAEFFGETYTLMNEGTPGYHDPIATQMREADTYEKAINLFIKYVITPARTGGSIHPDFYQGPESTKAGWQQNIDATEKHYEPGKFTTLHAFEWSAAPNAGNLHRNIIFRDAVVPDVPFSANESRDPRDLWKWMQLQMDRGSTLLAIPHNSNGSKGMMFPEQDISGEPIGVEYMKTRSKMEPLIEMMQIKGNSEVYPAFWPNDEFANFELAKSIQDYSGRTFEERNFVRYGLKRGLKHQVDSGVNPFKYGFIGGTDSHNGTPSNVEEDNYLVGSHGLADQSAGDRAEQVIDGWAKAYDINPGSLAGVWAESNNREAIWDAMKRKETFATSGPRIKVRLFGGFEYATQYDDPLKMIEEGYQLGVPMGGDLPKAQEDQSPSFLVYALKDPIGPNLDRVQIIKGWLENGELMEKIYNVVVSDGRLNPETGEATAIDAPVDLNTGAFNSEKGDAQMMNVWRDPDFDPSQQAFYYARVIQLPTARWTLWDEIREGVKYPDDLEKTIQERAWSSPIWYNP